MKHLTFVFVLLLSAGCTTSANAPLLQTQALVWGNIQTTADQSVAEWDWSAVDAAMAAQTDPVIMPIYPYALWDQATCHGDWPSMITVFGSHFQAPYPPCDQAAYQLWLQTLVTRYADQVAAWQVITTPTDQAAPSAEFIGPASVYGDLVILTANTIHQQDPTALVYVGQLSDLSPNTITFYTELLVREDLQAAVDALAVNQALGDNWSVVESLLDRANWDQPAYQVYTVQ